jgi:hypothetical protein
MSAFLYDKTPKSKQFPAIGAMAERSVSDRPLGGTLAR